MAAFPCPYCAREVDAEAEGGPRDLCSSCGGHLLIAYRYRLVALRGAISGGVLYEAVDDGFGEKVAVVFVEDPEDSSSVDRFVEGNRLFAELGGRGLVKLRAVGSRSDRRPYVVMDWIAQGTLEAVVGSRGPLDEALMFEVGRDLLTGLSKAHRSMPALVHGHVHPGKIGFLTRDQVVLFGFEWAQQVTDGPRKLADGFETEDTPDDGPHRDTDLHQLGRTLYYAATGEWIADRGIAQQRMRVRERLTGAIGKAIDRMLGAGADGYTSAVDAVTDFDGLMRGRSGWRPTVEHVQNRSGDLAGAAWVQDKVERPPQAVAPLDFEDALEEVYDDDDDQHHEQVFAPAPSRPTSSPPPQAHHAQTARAAAFAEAARKRELLAQIAAQQAPQQNPTKVVGLFVAALVVFGMCVAAVGDGDDDFKSVEVPREPVAVPQSYEPAYDPYEPSYDEPAPAQVYEAASLSGLHYYTGTITGPEQLAGFALGDRCEVWVEPNDGGLNCRWFIDCGEPARRIYGGGTAGYSSCSVVDGHPVFAQDEDDDVSDGAFVATLTDVDPMIMVMDRWLVPPTQVVISVDADGGPHPGPVRDVPLARRLSDSAIEAAIESGESPEFGSAADGLPDQLADDEILEVLDATVGDLRQCAEQADIDLYNLDELSFAVEIRKNGRVSKVAVSPSITRGVDGCMSKVIRRARFPTFSGDSMSIKWGVVL
ncbi:hypothetical protein [Enhygromyxa salina]|nr:hypothetical protein [Enhygromyxa salina]